MSVIAFDPTEQFQPLFPDQTEDVILARMIGWANEGLDPVADADQWVDTREGGHWRTCVTPIMREIARLYDLAGNDVPMSGFVLWSWGTYLDDLAAVWDVVRLPATSSQGVVTFSGPTGTEIAAGTTLLVVPSTPTDPAPSFTVTVNGTIPAGDLDLPIAATEPGLAGDVAAGAITEASTPLPSGVLLLGNAAPTTSGSDPETDDALRTRLLQTLAGKGPGAVRDYIRWAGAYPGVGRVQIVPIWNGPGTVLVLVSDVNGQPLSTALVSGLQTQLDPTPGQGHGIAPVGAAVTVDTSVLLAINVVASAIVFDTGYSWDGLGASVAVGPGIEAAVTKYLLTVPPGGQVVFAHILGIIATAIGVHDPGAVTVNGGTSNITVALLPTPQTPYLNTFTT